MVLRSIALLGIVLFPLLLISSPQTLGSQGDGLIATFAGGNVGDGRSALEVPSNRPTGVAVDGEGNVYFSEEFYERVRMIDAVTGIITTVAGNGLSAFAGDGGPASSASLNGPRGIEIDSAGNLFIADTGNNRIRRVDAQTGVITTVAGDGVARFQGDGGPATEASLDQPVAVALDSAGNLFISDRGNNRIRKVDATTGIITTFAGNGKEDAKGDGEPAAKAALNPAGMAFDAEGNLYVADFSNHLIRMIEASSGNISTVAGDGNKVKCNPQDPITCFPSPVGTKGNGRFNQESGPALRISLNFPTDIVIDSEGNIIIADTNNQRIRRLVPDEAFLETIAGSSEVDRATGIVVGGLSGDGGPALTARLNRPTGVALDATGNLFIADSENDSLRMIDPSGIITTHAGGRRSFGDGGPATEAAVYLPWALATDGDGNLFVAEPTTGRIRRIDHETGMITTVAGNGSIGVSPDGGPATEASLADPVGLATDSFGNLYISEFLSHRIRKVDRETGTITTVAGNGTPGFSGDGGPAIEAQLKGPRGIAVDLDDNLYIADGCNHRIRRIDRTTGVITTIAGTGFSVDPDLLCSAGAFSGDKGPATEASLSFPEDVDVDPEGNIIIADRLNLRIRIIDAGSQKITTLAGSSSQGFRDGSAKRAKFADPRGVAFDGLGNVFVTDQANNRVRYIDRSGRNATVSTVAGAGDVGFLGDGGPAGDAWLRGPLGITVGPDGGFLFSDVGNHRVRQVK